MFALFLGLNSLIFYNMNETKPCSYWTLDNIGSAEGWISDIQKVPIIGISEFGFEYSAELYIKWAMSHVL